MEERDLKTRKGGKYARETELELLMVIGSLSDFPASTLRRCGGREIRSYIKEN
jgi:hypothetical protein